MHAAPDPVAWDTDGKRGLPTFSQTSLGDPPVTLSCRLRVAVPTCLGVGAVGGLFGVGDVGAGLGRLAASGEEHCQEKSGDDGDDDDGKR